MTVSMQSVYVNEQSDDPATIKSQSTGLVAIQSQFKPQGIYNGRRTAHVQWTSCDRVKLQPDSELPAPRLLQRRCCSNFRNIVRRTVHEPHKCSVMRMRGSVDAEPYRHGRN
jgi:hypothetical protein